MILAIAREYHSKYEIPDMSVWQHCMRVLKNGPEMVGTEILTREQAYTIIWQIIFDQHKRIEKYRPPADKLPAKNQSIPKPIPASRNPEKTGIKYNPLKAV